MHKRIQSGSGKGRTIGLYKEQRAGQQRRMNDFLSKYAFFAFSEKQFNEGLKQLGIAPGTKGAIATIPAAGIYWRTRRRSSRTF